MLVLYPEFVKHGKKTNFKRYYTDIITDKTIEFLKNRPKQQPIFAMCH